MDLFHIGQVCILMYCLYWVAPKIVITMKEISK
jgi:hypothetical protein